MEQVIEKIKTDDKNLQKVAEVLILQCKKEPAFVEKILDETKTIKDCWEYIKSKAQKEAINRVAVIDDETVYGWAIHYFDEKELDDWKSLSQRAKEEEERKQKIEKAKKASEEREKQKKANKLSKEVSDDEESDEEYEDDEDSENIETKQVNRAIKVVDNQKKEIPVKKPKGIAEGQISLF